MQRLCERCERVVVVLVPGGRNLCESCRWVEERLCPYEYSIILVLFVFFGLWFVLTYPYYP